MTDWEADTISLFGEGNVILIFTHDLLIFKFFSKWNNSLSPSLDQIYYLYECYTNIFFIKMTFTTKF